MPNCCEMLRNYFPEKCLISTSRAEEEGKRFSLKIPPNSKTSEHACLVRIDGCWIPSNEQKKCDFLMVACTTKTLYLIEFKGRDDHDKAINQILSTYQHLKKNAAELMATYQCSGYVIASRVPKADTGFARLKDRAMRDYKLKIERVSQECVR